MCNACLATVDVDTEDGLAEEDNYDEGDEE